MANFFNHRYFNSAILLTILTSFSIGTTIPMSAGEYEMKKAGINEGIFMAKIEKLIKKLKKTENKTSKDMMEALLDIKDEIELSFNIKFNMDDIWETFNKKMSEGNVNLPKETIESFQHDFKKRNKKRKHHAIHIEEMIESDT